MILAAVVVVVVVLGAAGVVRPTDGTGTSSLDSSSKFTVASSPAGLGCLTVNASGYSVAIDTADSGIVGSDVTLTISGFDSADGVFVFLADEAGGELSGEVGSLDSGASEPAVLTVKVPTNYESPTSGHYAPGSYYFWAEDVQSACAASVAFDITAVPPAPLYCSSGGANDAVLTVTPDEGAFGASITLGVSNFAPYGDVDIYFAELSGADDVYVTALSSPDSVTGDYVPSGFSAGTYAFWGVDTYNDCAGAIFTLSGESAPSITVTPDQTPIGGTFSVSGTGFTASALAVVLLDNSTSSQELVPSSCTDGAVSAGEVLTDSSGDFTCSFEVPGGDSAGPYTLVGVDESTSLQSSGVSFTVTPQLTITAPYVPIGPVGTAITVTGSGWASGDDLQFEMYEISGCDVEDCITPGITCINPLAVSATGGFTCTGTIPEFDGAGVYEVGAYVNGGPSAFSSNTFTVTGPPTVTVSPSAGPPNSPTTFTETGLTPYEVYAVYFDASQGVMTTGSENATQFTTLADGSYSGTFTLPGGLVSGAAYSVDVFEEVLGTYSYVGSASTEFTQTLGLTITQPYVPVGPPGTIVTLAGTGGTPGDGSALEYELVEYPSLPVTDVSDLACLGAPDSIVSPTIDSDGDFTCDVEIPSVTSGAYAIYVQDTDTGAYGFSSEDFIISSLSASTITTDPDQGSMGSPVSLTAQGLTPATEYAVYFDLDPGIMNPGASWFATEFTTLSDGGYAGTFDVPNGLTVWGYYFVDVYQVVSGNAYYIATDATEFEVALWTTTTVVSCSPVYGWPTTTCTATVTGEGAAITGEPYSITGETVEWAADPGDLAFWPQTCALSGSPESCSVAVTIVQPIPDVVESITAIYIGDASNEGSDGSSLAEFHGMWQLSPTTTTFSCTPDYGDPSTSCTATVTGATGSISGELVYWSSNFPLTFSPTACVLTGSPESCSVSVAVVGVPFIDNYVTISALYAGDLSNAPSAASGGVEFYATPPTGTATAVTCNPGYGDPSTTCTATVTGATGSITGELVAWSSNSQLAFSPVTCVLAGSPESCSVLATVVGHPFAADAVTITAAYAGDTANAPSQDSRVVEFDSSYATSLTTTAISCSPGVGDPSTVCTATVTGESSDISGEPVEWSEFSGVPGILGFSPDVCSLSGAPESCSVSVGPMFPPTSEDVLQAVYPGDGSDSPSAGTLSAEFVVPPPSIEVEPGQAPATGAYTVAGDGFTPSSGAAVSFSGLIQIPTACSDGTFTGAEITTDSSGDFACAFLVPGVWQGTYLVVGEDVATGSLTAASPFMVTPLTLTVTPGSGPVGAPVTVSGTGFTVDSPVGLNFDGVTTFSCTTGSLTTGGSGDFSCTFAVPARTDGTAVNATDASGQTVSATFTVTKPTITVSPDRGPAGAPYGVEGSGFTPSSGVTVSFGGAIQTPVGCTNGLPPSPTIMTDASGDFDCAFVDLEVTAGSYPIVATDLASGALSPTEHFRVTTPAISLVPARGPAAASFTVVASGFSISSYAFLEFAGVYQPAESCSEGSETLGEVTTSPTGTFQCTFEVPSVASGPHNVEVEVEGTFATPTKTFTVTTPTVTVSPDRGPVGAPYTVAGSGFSVGSEAVVSFAGADMDPDSCTVGTYSGTGSIIVTDGSGAFRCAFTVPNLAARAYSVLGVDLATSTDTAAKTFTVTTPAIVLSSSRGAVGATYSVSGTGFSVSSGVTVSFDGVAQTPTSCSTGTFSGSVITTSGSGAFKCTFTVPNDVRGTYTVLAEDLASGGTAAKTYTIIL